MGEERTLPIGTRSILNELCNIRVKADPTVVVCTLFLTLVSEHYLYLR